MLPANSQPPLRRQSRARRFIFGGIALIALSYLATSHFDALPENIPVWQPDHTERFKAGCAQPDPIFPSKDEELDKLQDFIDTEAFRNATIARLSGAVQVKSESFDDLGAVGEDPRWEVFYDFSAYLKDTFPLIHEKLLVEKINSHGLLYTWKGSDESLKPSLLMAHQDTVPVPPETIGAWTYPPW
jgi:Gly-Xaa carboxypeptidase